MIDLTNTIKIAKSMKRAIVHINSNYMLGTDLEYSTLSVIEYSSEISRSITAMMKDIIDKTAADKIANENFPLYALEYSAIDNMYYHSWDELGMYEKVFDLFKRVNFYVRTFPLVFHLDALERNQGFMSLLKTRVSDGLSTFLLEEKYLMTTFNKVHAINAKDKVSLNIYDLDSISYLYEFFIDKKTHIVKEYIRYRKMINDAW